MAVVTKYIDQCAAGFLLEKEIEYLGKTLEAPEKPFVAIIGGAKISGKIDVVTNLMDKCDAILIGGGMAFTFDRARGITVGNSLVEEDKSNSATEIIKQAEEKGVKLMLPVDAMCADVFSAEANTKIVEGDIEDGWMGLDIGRKQLNCTAKKSQTRKQLFGTVRWVALKWHHLQKAFSFVKAVANADCVSIIGGGDSVSAVNKSGVADKMSHVSTGGGASLEFMEGKAMPGIVALTDK